jgi:hypothetical protein
MRMIKKIWGKIKLFFKTFYKTFIQIQRDKATGFLEFELKEMENMFVIQLFGSFVGLPSPPLPIALKLMPYMEQEISLMLSRADSAQDPLGEMVSLFDID